MSADRFGFDAIQKFPRVAADVFGGARLAHCGGGHARILRRSNIAKAQEAVHPIILIPSMMNVLNMIFVFQQQNLLQNVLNIAHH